LQAVGPCCSERMWPTSLSSLYEHANELASKASDMKDVASDRLQSRLSEAASASPQEVLSRVAWLASSAAETAAGGSIVLARQAKLKGEISLLDSNAKAWKREWGEESFDAFYQGDLEAVTLSLYRCKAEMEKITDMIRAKQSCIEGLAQYGQSYDDVLHGALRRWRVRVSASRAVRNKHLAVLGSTSQLARRCALRTWRRLLVQGVSNKPPTSTSSTPHGEHSSTSIERWLVPD